VRRIKKISLILKEPLEELPKNMFLNKVSGSIIFKGVYFTYQKELPAVLSDINLTLERLASLRLLIIVS
jgi:ABC-type bacteriocin/lantibiotic exporter with double-glycine peptidase domain